ncbi:GPP34 family phosphoprotein [Acrocarpospora macrocephala]|uniref:GOLPH3/VPS74 family protein n=1 Tax=Acrocarpospora sp. B8E8 TaxID=3153572 RepID=UPI002483CA6A
MAEGDLPASRLADDLYFVMHDDVTGRGRIHPRLTGLGLAAAILGELMLAGRVTVRLVPGQIQLAVVDPAETGDAPTQFALDHIQAEPTHPVGTWLLFLARTAHADIAARMTEAGLLHPPGRRLLAKQVQAPVAANTAAWPVGRLNLAIERRQPLRMQDGVLFGLIVATGGGQLVLWDANPRYLRESLAALPETLQQLIAQTEAACGDAVISRR